MTLERPTSIPGFTDSEVAKLTALSLLHECLHARYSTSFGSFESRKRALNSLLWPATDRLFNVIEDGRISALGRVAGPAITSHLAEFADLAVEPAIRLGHNLDTASVVVVDGLVFSYEMFDQFIARAHRLSSRKPVTVYVMLTEGSLDEKKWALLSAKAAAADLALDGQLMDEREEPISLEQVLKELQAKGVPLTGEEIAESELQAAWENTGNVIPFAARPKPMAPVEPLGETEQLELFAA
jgi:hypothetical protein